MTDKKHPTHLHTNVPSRALGAELARLRYDLLHEVLIGMFQDLRKQAKADEDLGREILSNGLYSLSYQLEGAHEIMRDEILPVCKKYIDKEKNDT